MSIAAFIAEVKRWAAPRADVRAIALVGSHARGNARPDSDIDLVLLCVEPARYLEHHAWLSEFGEPVTVALEDWGRVQALRVRYRSQLEVEFGFTTNDWASLPADAGTASVVRGGMLALVDSDGALDALAAAQR